jgi:hypothetical protein
MLVCVVSHPSDAAEGLAASFHARTQALFDALVKGDKTVWDRTLDDDCLITTEDGKFLSKAEMLKDVRPLPAGFAAHIDVRDVTVRRVGDAAVVHYWLDEVETIFGQELRTTYVQTDTYRRADGVWKAIAQHETVVPRDLEPIAVDSRDWKQLLGYYRFSERATSRSRGARPRVGRVSGFTAGGHMGQWLLGPGLCHECRLERTAQYRPRAASS